MGVTSLKYLMNKRRLSLIVIIVLGFYFGEVSYAIVPTNSGNRIKFQQDITKFRSTLNLPVIVKDQKISIPDKQITARMTRSTEDPRIEPLQLTVEDNDERILELASKVAQPRQRLALANYLKSNFANGEEIPGTTLRLVTIDKNAYKMLNRSAIDSLFSKIHHDVTINTAMLKNNPKLRDTFMSQISPFLPNKDIQEITGKISNASPLSLDKDLLPEFARKRVANHTIFRGPNCFHAALAFQSTSMASSSLVNIRREQGYHRDMINYDELWRILQLSFYEIDPQRTELQYGDMIVFFETKDAASGIVDFKTLRHAATYLFGGYVFAKGSKSANSPYLVRTLGEEWSTWSKFTKQLGVKVFRRSLKHVSNPIPVDPIDWAY